MERELTSPTAVQYAGDPHPWWVSFDPEVPLDQRPPINGQTGMCQ
jgi:hypothetical protein